MNDQDKNIAVLTAHMEHVVKDMTEIKSDLKAIPDKMANQYVPKSEFEDHRKDHSEMRADMKALITRIDGGHFVSRDDARVFVTQDQFSPYKYTLIFIATAVGGAIIKLAFDLFTAATSP